ncbi:2-dehydro-3-deoxy-D-arabinonate dehydratase [Spirosomataceae bacterium TFI 002]|nr:2-dehydro-3-deoxy-D-arabinonate dehydratase [Spirosomataceae bacterium TFI 002]
MKIYKTSKGFVIANENEFYLSKHKSWDEFINRENLNFELQREIQKLTSDIDNRSLILDFLEAPIQNQEVWASGVTYMRSKNARMEESKDSGGGDFYDRVYDAARPELFFKATATRVVGHGDDVRIRKDSKWNVPEPELTLFTNSKGQIQGYTIGNDMSSRDIEGENPLYLPQAKTYDKSAALGPCILVPDEPIDPSTEITLEIVRGSSVVFKQSIEINQMKRGHKELVDYLFAECSFPNGCFLMTGTGIIPPDEFTLAVNDIVNIYIEGIGKLTNTVKTK